MSVTSDKLNDVTGSSPIVWYVSDINNIGTSVSALAVLFTLRKDQDYCILDLTEGSGFGRQKEEIDFAMTVLGLQERVCFMIPLIFVEVTDILRDGRLYS